MSLLKHIKRHIKQRVEQQWRNRQGVALFIVLTAMATLAIFVGEITYTAQVNQKLAYDRLDQIKAHSLAKSGLRLALLRIRAYTELKKTISTLTGGSAAGAAAANQAVPKAILEKIWSEPITIPFSGDLSSLPTAAKDAILKFRKDSNMEGRVYISIQAQSSKFNLNSTLSTFAAAPSASASPTPTPAANPGVSPTPVAGSTPANGGGTAGATPTATPTGFDQAQARALLLQQLKDTFQKKFDDDEKFRDRYRSLKVEDLSDEILGWSDLSYDSLAAQRATTPFKQAPFYDISELHYLPTVDDEIYNLLESQYQAGVASAINVNTIKESVLTALVPQMTIDDRKKFFEFRDSTGDTPPADGQDNTFKSADDFFKYLKEKVAAFAGSDSKVNDFKTALTQRGISITTDESNFIVRIEATLNQTKRTLEAWVSVLPDDNTTPSTGTGANGAKTSPTPTPAPAKTNAQGTPGTPDTTDSTERSNLKITQLRFL